MGRTKRKKNSRLTEKPDRWLLTCLSGLYLILWPGEVWANTTALDQPSVGQVNINNISALGSGFIYQRGNRSDPFVPFISERTTTQQIETEELLTGMRLFEPGQLNLVAISFGGNNPIALVQDSTGKGYILKEGIAIGRKGVITSIMANSVIIEESFLTSSGEKKTRSIKMVLRKEGEK